jgi:hypothetical protein
MNILDIFDDALDECILPDSPIRLFRLPKFEAPKPDKPLKALRFETKIKIRFDQFELEYLFMYRLKTYLLN